ncbi:MAG: YbaN family protein [Anaerolineae bacterium]|nr:YbaN family protein [Anaerolineae bacterium]
MKPLPRLLLIIGGTVCVALGIVGMFIPILPTTPFLLLAAACYIRSSERFYRWLVGNHWIGKYIRSYREGKGIPKSQKVLALLALWLTIGTSAFFGTSQWWLRALLFLIGLGVTIHILKLKTYRAEKETADHTLRIDEAFEEKRLKHCSWIIPICAPPR